ncbi:23S rRNA (pseudouridine(1915)-N(3))-methyltransferase RlmH [Nisaea acidiphila]|uniref:Ribosomal RNA large subunit methyltransferase H n=1 Tax=Nisaea acidiphila TaxID=1862145 RepID=A0A9J7AP17_9PROT|nr:23S rRNA (pseudouridine(1915)-N(3))-methyltransferase RlmH [Nisaea acidiphila]UUX48084.1 23S rRNA (pseudouridine(1915)-N(3))-methyltransferase RlmH [Nisaea acidiphila]
MKLTLAAVGKARRDVHAELFAHYRARLSWPLDLKEVDIRRKLPPEQLQEEEATQLLAQVPDGAIAVVLDERGKTLSSAEFANRIGAWRDDGVRDIVFLIGGADGHHESCRKRADLLLSLGRATWPHMLVRGMIAEQLYRAQQILAGHPYHRE